MQQIEKTSERASFFPAGVLSAQERSAGKIRRKQQQQQQLREIT